MFKTEPANKSQLLTDLPPYVYGTTRLGDQNIPLPADIVDEIVQLHYRWSDEFDRKAELWSI